MTKQPNQHDQGALVSAALQAKATAITEAATRRLNKRSERGTFVSTVTEDQWDYALERIANGDLEANIARELGVHRSAFNDKRDRDLEFEERYQRAILNGYVNIAHDARAVARGLEGYSTGDVRRDELVVKTDIDLAKRFAAKILGDKLQVDQRSITINLDPNDPNGDFTKM